MTTGRKVFSSAFIVMWVFVSGIFWQLNRRLSQLNNQTNNQISVLESWENDIDKLNKELDELDRMIAEIDKADAAIKNLQRLPKPTNGVTSSHHDKDGKKNYENSWIDDIDKEKGIVLVRTFDGKMLIVFKPAPENLDNFNKSWIAPVTFQCTKFKKKKCDYDAPYKLFVSNGLVEVKQLIFTKK